MSGEDLLLAIRARGSDARDLRDAAHEACHALAWKVKGKWTRKKIETSNPYRRRSLMSFGIGDEITARAVEQLVCARLGVECDPVSRTVMTMCMETAKFDGVSLPYDEMVTAVTDRMKSTAAVEMADRVLALAQATP